MQKALADTSAGGGDFLDQTIAVWQPYSDRPLSREDAREIVENVVGFFNVLRDWDHAERSRLACGEEPPRLDVQLVRRARQKPARRRRRNGASGTAL